MRIATQPHFITFISLKQKRYLLCNLDKSAKSMIMLSSYFDIKYINALQKGQTPLRSQIQLFNNECPGLDLHPNLV